MRHRIFLREPVNDYYRHSGMPCYRSPTVRLWDSDSPNEFDRQSFNLLRRIVPLTDWIKHPQPSAYEKLPSYLDRLNQFLSQKHGCFYKEVAHGHDPGFRTFKLFHFHDSMLPPTQLNA